MHFDNGESFVVAGLALVGRRPEARSGEQVAHLVPLASADMSVSKTHAQFGPASDGTLVVMDRGSTNGTVLVRQGVSRQLAPGQARDPRRRRQGRLRRPRDDRLPRALTPSPPRCAARRRHDVRVATFLDLLYDEAPLAAFDEHLAQASRGLDEAGAARVRSDYDVALRLRDLMSRMRSREAELSALYETASDLTAIRDVDTILTAIVRRARQLLHCDMTYLSLNDEDDGASYMKVTDGALTREFQNLRLPLGTGLLGLVAQTGAAYFTEDYSTDERFVHKGFIDEAVAGEQIRAILGVPLVLDGVVIGALLAVHRSVRRFPQSEISLLTSFAAHAVVALENARLFAELDEANRSLTRHTEAVDAAALAHDRLTDLLLDGGGVAEVAEVLSGVLDGDGRRSSRPPASCWPATTPGWRGPRPCAGAVVLGSLGRSSTAASSRPRSPAPSTWRPWCCVATSRSTSPAVVRSSAARWSPRWCCSSPVPSPTPRSASAGSSSSTSSRPTRRRAAGCASAYDATARASTARWWWRRPPSTTPTGTAPAGLPWRWRAGCRAWPGSTAARSCWSCRARTRCGWAPTSRRW